MTLEELKLKLLLLVPNATDRTTDLNIGTSPFSYKVVIDNNIYLWANNTHFFIMKLNSSRDYKGRLERCTPTLLKVMDK